MRYIEGFKAVKKMTHDTSYQGLVLYEYYLFMKYRINAYFFKRYELK